jgi:hypothetical protein
MGGATMPKLPRILSGAIMLERLGHVLGWIGNLLAFLAVVSAATFWYFIRNEAAP